MGKKSAGLTEDQDIKYWLMIHSRRDHAWIVEHQIAEILLNARYLDVNNQAVPANEFQLRYTYSAMVNKDCLLAVVEGRDGAYYAIRNRKLNVESDSESGSDSESDSEIFSNPAKPKLLEINENTVSKLERESIKFKVEKERAEKELKLDRPIDELIESLVTRSTSLETLIRSLNSTEKSQLAIVKPQRMKLTKEERAMWPERLTLALGPDASDWLENNWYGWLMKQTDLLDLVGCFWVTEDAFEWRLPKITTLTLNQNFRIMNFDWLTEILPNLREINLINMASLTVEAVEVICLAVPGLREFSLHYCPRVNIRVLLNLLRLEGIDKIVLNQIDLVCQTNAYSGLVGPDEWAEVAYSPVTKLLINSTNLSLDVVDYLMPICHNLERLVVHPVIAKNLKENIKENENSLGLETTSELIIAGLDNKQFTVKRPFKIGGRLKDKYDEPISDSMKQKMAAIKQQEMLLDESDWAMLRDLGIEEIDGENKAIVAELLAEMKAEQLE